MSNNDDILISQLISETYIDGDSKDQPNDCIDLRNYFEKRLNQVDYLSINDYIAQHELVSNDLELVKKTKCYRLVINGSVLDFPSNWSVFKDLRNKELVFIDQSLDQDFLLDIFSEITGSFSNLAMVNESENVRVIFLPEEASKDHVQWIRGYLEKKGQSEIKEAA
jgi:hypothetical protein